VTSSAAPAVALAAGPKSNRLWVVITTPCLNGRM
jgi:hypothetical protein